MNNTLILIILIILFSFVPNNLIAQQVFEANKDLYCCEIGDVFTEINNLNSSIPMRKEFESREEYLLKKKTINDKIENIRSKLFYTSIDFNYSNYDMVNESIKLTIKLPYQSIRKNDLSYSNSLSYLLTIPSSQAPGIKGKLQTAKLKIYFQLVEGKKLYISKTKLLYFDETLKVWE
jgi:hypothetical protein